MPYERQAMLSAEGLKSLGFSCAQAPAGNSIRTGNVEKIPLPVGSLIQYPEDRRTLIPNRGEEIRSLRHVGHRPGRVNRARSRKIKPQLRHSAVSRTNRRVLSRVRLRAIWLRWSSASRSGIA